MLNVYISFWLFLAVMGEYGSLPRIADEVCLVQIYTDFGSFSLSPPIAIAVVAVCLSVCMTRVVRPEQLPGSYHHEFLFVYKRGRNMLLFGKPNTLTHLHSHIEREKEIQC